MADADEDFRGTERFRVLRRLGAGAFGVVYEAFDREREDLVALKTFRQGNVDALYRLKREFRALADITHPNLVTLHEMLSDGERWFMTMELVRGAPFLHYVRRESSAVPASSLQPTDSVTSQDLDDSAATATSSERPFDEHRLRAALRQVASAVAALHDAGKLHRDIKPSNVLVTEEGRVVVLDFGLVADFEFEGQERSLSLVGTPAYMAPELGSRKAVSEASDWYSLGVMLYEALTGHQPFNGTLTEIMWNKNQTEPPAPRGIVPAIPADLDSLCRALLRRDPTARPNGDMILRRFGVPAPPPDRAPGPPSLSLRPGPFVGRKAELAALRRAFEASRQGRMARVYVSGTSGIGKSALVRRFVDDLRKEDAVVLTGRCYERESAPYKALDSLIDSLSEFLRRLPKEECESLLPSDILALTRVFPVLRRVDAVASSPRKVVEIADAFELRRRAFAALRDLFVRLAGRRDVMLFIDDLQWGDADSAALIEELVRPPDPPSLLLVLCFRSEEAATSPFLKNLLRQAESGDLTRLTLEELEQGEARELAAALLETRGSRLPARSENIARESAGNPFFIDELVRFGRIVAETTIDAMVRARVLQLPEPARHLLEVVAVAGQPVDAEVGDAAAGLRGDSGALQVLRIGRLIRVRATTGREELETYHDRIREAVVAQIPPGALEEHHRKIAVALETSGRADPEQLANHFREAGDLERAARYAASAADRAAETLAFDRAAKLYRMALELKTSADAETQRTLGTRLGDALANAGRGAESAQAYLAAAEGAPRGQALELERRAAGHLLQAGHVDRALPIFERVTGRLGLTLVQPSWKTSLLFLAERALIRLRGYRFRERDASQVPPEQLIRLDSYWLLASGIVLINTIRARELNSRHLLMALRVGEPSHVAIALATELGVLSTVGWRLKNRVNRILPAALALAERLKDPKALGMVHAYASAANVLLGRWKACSAHGETAVQLYRERCTGVFWELDFAQMMLLRGLFYLGALKELSLRVPELIREARQRNDLMAVAGLRTRHAYAAYLASDGPGSAREDLQQMMADISNKTFTNPHYWALNAAGEIVLYEGDPEAGWNLLREQSSRLEKSGLLRMQLYLIESRHLRARSAIGCATQESVELPKKERLLRSATHDVRQIERTGAPWGLAVARLDRAGIAAARKHESEALRLLESVELDFRMLEMALYAAVARRRRGQLLGGDAGAALVAEADAWMAGQDIKNPARMADMLAPGRWA